MGFGFNRASTRQLTSASFVPTRSQRRQQILLGALSGIVFAGLGIAVFYLFAPDAESVRQLSSARTELSRLAKRYDERELELRMTGAKTLELERQIEILNQRIREQQDEIAFYRKAKETRKQKE